MMKLAAVALVAAVAALSGAAAQPTPPFCHDLDCPRYTVVAQNATANVEIRRYQSAQWVSTNVTGMSFDTAQYTGFNRLFKYIGGANEKNMKVKMAAPVLVDIYPGQGPSCNSTFVVSFFIDFDLQGKAPAPTEGDTYLRVAPEMTVGVRSFPGYAVWSNTQPEFTALAASLAANGTKVDPSHEIFAGYDAPFRVIGRHNEVMFVVTK